MSEPGPVLGLDYGTKRIGVAASDPARVTAFPVTVLTVGPDLWEELRALVDERGVDLVVVGLPVGLSGQEGDSARAARELADEVANRLEVEIEFADERFTTRSAEQVLIDGNVRRSKRRDVIDKMAAAVMLQNYLDTRRSPPK